MASAALEMGTRPGPVKDLIASLQAQFGELIRGFAVPPLARNELPAGEDPGRLAFELNGIMLATDTNFVQHDDPAVLDLARQIVRQRLGVASAASPVCRSVDFPGVVAGQQGGEVTGAAAAAGGVDLLRHQLVVARLLDLAEDADRGVPEVRRVQPGQRERVGRVGAVRVVRDQRVLVGRGHLDRLELAVRAEPQALESAPNRIGSPCSSLISRWPVAPASLSGANASSLKMGQFW